MDASHGVGQMNCATLQSYREAGNHASTLGYRNFPCHGPVGCMHELGSAAMQLLGQIIVQ